MTDRMDEYRRVLTEWARLTLPEDLGNVETLDVRVTFHEGHVWSEVTIDDPSCFITITYRDRNGKLDNRIQFVHADVSVTELLRTLFQLAEIIPPGPEPTVLTATDPEPTVGTTVVDQTGRMFHKNEGVGWYKQGSRTPWIPESWATVTEHGPVKVVNTDYAVTHKHFSES